MDDFCDTNCEENCNNTRRGGELPRQDFGDEKIHQLWGNDSIIPR